MDLPWDAQPLERRREGRRRSDKRHPRHNEDERVNRESMIDFLSGLKGSLQSALHAPEPTNPEAGEQQGPGSMIYSQQSPHTRWERQLQERPRHTQRQRWEQQEEALDEPSPSMHEQHMWHRNMRYLSSRKPQKPKWTCLQQLQKTLTIDSADEEDDPPSAAAAPASAAFNSLVENPSEVAYGDEYERQQRQKQHERRHHRRRPNGVPGRHSRRQSYRSDQYQGFDFEYTDEESAQAAGRYDHVSPVASPRFGRPEVDEEFSQEPSSQQFPGYDNRRESAQLGEHDETGAYSQPWTDATNPFPASASTAATDVNSPSLRDSSITSSVSRRYHQHSKLHKQQQKFEGMSRQEASWLADSGPPAYSSELPVDPSVPRRHRLIEIANRFPLISEVNEGLETAQPRLRDLREQLDEGLREALTQDLLEFQKEAFLSVRRKSAAKAKLQLPKEEVEEEHHGHAEAGMAVSVEAETQEEAEEAADVKAEAATGIAEASEDASGADAAQKEELAVVEEEAQAQGTEEENREALEELLGSSDSEATKEQQVLSPIEEANGEEIEELEEPLGASPQSDDDCAAEEEAACGYEESKWAMTEGESLQATEQNEEVMEEPQEPEATEVTEADEEDVAAHAAADEDEIEGEAEAAEEAAAVEAAEEEEEGILASDFTEDEGTLGANPEIQEALSVVNKATQCCVEEERQNNEADEVTAGIAEKETEEETPPTDGQKEEEPLQQPQPCCSQGEVATSPERGSQKEVGSDQLTLEALRALSVRMLQPLKFGTAQVQQKQQVERSIPNWGANLFPHIEKGESLPASDSCVGGRQLPREDTDLVYGLLTHRARLHQLLLMEATEMATERQKMPFNSFDSSADSFSSNIPPGYRQRAPQPSQEAPSAAQYEQNAAREDSQKQPEAAPVVEATQDKEIIDNPSSLVCEESTAAAQNAQECLDSPPSAKQETGTAASAPDKNEADTEPKSAVSSSKDADSEAAGSSRGCEGCRNTEDSPSLDLAAVENTGDSLPALAEREEQPQALAESSETEGRKDEDSSADATAASAVEAKAAAEAAAAAKAAAAAATTAEAAALEATRAAAAATAALKAHAVAAAAAAEKEKAAAELSPPEDSPRIPQDQKAIHELQGLHEENIAAAAAKRIISSAVNPEDLISYDEAKIRLSCGSANVAQRRALPIPPPARGSKMYHPSLSPIAAAPQLAAIRAVSSAGTSKALETVRTLEENGLYPHVRLDGKKNSGKEEIVGASSQRTFQHKLQQQLRLKLVQQQANIQTLPQLQETQQILPLQPEQPILKLQQLVLQQQEQQQLAEKAQIVSPQDGSTSSRRRASRVRFADETLKNEELKEQLRKQAKELRKLRHFRDVQHTLHEETEQHIDRLHTELKNLADENLNLLEQQKQTGLGAQQLAFNLLRLHALGTKRGVPVKDAAVSPRGEQTTALEHVLQQNRELEQMQWQLQQLRQRVTDNRATQQADEQRLLELQQSEARLQQENNNLRQMLQTLSAAQQQQASAAQAEHEKSRDKLHEEANTDLRRTLAAEQQARLEAEEQLRETLEVMQLLKQCLQDHKEKAASLEYHVKELQELQRQQKEEQLQRAFEASQSAAILEALDREQNTGAPQAAQETVSTTAQEDQPCKASTCQDSPETVKKETSEMGIQAGPPMPYGSHTNAAAEEHQQLLRQAAQQQQLIARLKSALATQAKTLCQEKTYYQQLVLKFQQRIAELERYQHQLLLHVQQQQQQLLQQQHQAASLQSVASGASQRPPFVLQAPPVFVSAPAASSPTAPVLTQTSFTAADVQAAARAAAERQHQQRGCREVQEGTAARVDIIEREAEADPSCSARSEDWLKLLSEAIEEEENKQRTEATPGEAQDEGQRRAIFDRPGTPAAVTLATQKGATSVSATREDTAHVEIQETQPACYNRDNASAALEEALSVDAVEPKTFGAQEQQQAQQQLIQQLQDSLQGKVYVHLEKLQRTLSSDPNNGLSLGSVCGRGISQCTNEGQEAAGELIKENLGHSREGRDKPLLTSHEQQTPLEHRLQHLLQQKQREKQQQISILSIPSSPAYASPFGTTDSVSVSLPLPSVPSGLECRALLKRSELNRSPTTSTTASTVVGDDISSAPAFPSALCKPPEKRDGENGEEVSGARQKVQQLRQLLRQQGLLN